MPIARSCPLDGTSLELNDKGEVAAANASTPRASFPYQHMFANPGRQKTPLSVLSAEGSPLPSGFWPGVIDR